MAKELSQVAVNRTSLFKITLKMKGYFMTKFTKGDNLELALTIKGSLVYITFKFLGTKKVVDNVDYFEFVSVTSNPFPRNFPLR